MTCRPGLARLHRVTAVMELLLGVLRRCSVTGPTRTVTGRHRRSHLLVLKSRVGLMTETDGPHRHMKIDDGLPGGQEGGPHVGDVV